MDQFRPMLPSYSKWSLWILSRIIQVLQNDERAPRVPFFVFLTTNLHELSQKIGESNSLQVQELTRLRSIQLIHCITDTSNLDGSIDKNNRSQPDKHNRKRNLGYTQDYRFRSFPRLKKQTSP